MKRALAWMMPVLIAIFTDISAYGQNERKMNMTEKRTDVEVEIKTTLGDITVLLYGDTPKHQENFLKLVGDSFYDGVLFHRVIDKFMVQTGDPDSKNAPAGKRLGSGGPGYQIDAEIVYPVHFHRRGALAAARQGDAVNPGKRSSGSQFYIVTGKKVSAGQLDEIEARMRMQQKRDVFQRLADAERDSIAMLQRSGDREALEQLRQRLIKETEGQVAASPVSISEEMRQAYVNEGGTPHLDGAYTVFGQVIDGMDVVERIEKATTDAADRPVEDIKILSMKMLN